MHAWKESEPVLNLGSELLFPGPFIHHYRTNKIVCIILFSAISIYLAFPGPLLFLYGFSKTYALYLTPCSQLEEDIHFKWTCCMSLNLF